LTVKVIYLSLFRAKNIDVLTGNIEAWQNLFS